MSKATEIITKAKNEGRTFVTEPEAYAILEEYGVKVAPWALCDSAKTAVEEADRIGYPVVMKVVSPQIVHKTEFGAVKVNISSPQKVEEAYFQLMGSALDHEGVEVTGILVSKMLKGLEIIVGSTRDPQFGPLLMFGLGGVFVEVFKDVSYRIAPLEEIDVDEMLSELKGNKLIHGFRGMEGVNIEDLKRVLISISTLLTDLQDIAEMDLNPIFGNSTGVRVADARIILG
ncbi:MAG TPA: acetate--CoA ligase family protein [Methanomassiliicoccales archaeon]|nr:acetate--CoA ligase family protein [Methanomassiliicoccales archaeon]